MGSYQTIVVGTDGSASSLVAVERAGALAGEANARLVVACAYFPDQHDRGMEQAKDVLGREAYQVVGSSPAEERARTAADRARAAGARDVLTAAVTGEPVDVLLRVVAEHGAGLLVVGNRGLNTIKDRLLGSVPSDATRRAGCDVLVVHTTD
ncbi:MAG: universal stress protein [Actinomycetota bacterium]|nr:universal stress protein [Actinomycetota bacterium]